MKNENNVQDFQIKELFDKSANLQTGLDKANEAITSIKDNHLAHIGIDLNTTKTNVEWLLKYHWIIATASIGALVASLINLMKH